MPDLLTDLARVREALEAMPDNATESQRAAFDAEAANFCMTHLSGIEAMARDAAARNRGPWREVVWTSPSVEGQHTARYNVNTDEGARRLFGEGACWGAFPDDAVIVEIRAGDDRHVF